MRRVFAVSVLVLIFTAARPFAQTAPKTLDIYYIDTEGGQATLFVSPTGQSVLVDTGNAGTRDPERIAEVTKAAGLKQIDYLVITHYHGDHIGGFPELAKLIPIMHYVDHGPTVQPEQNTPSKQAYDAAIAKGPYTAVKPGDKVPVTGIDWVIVTAAGKTLKSNMSGAPGAGKSNPTCADFKPKDILTDLENGQSTGSVVTYGKFRTVDLGDLLWNVEADLMCPINPIGTVDVYLTTHHGQDQSNAKQVVHALEPRVTIMNNGTRKGAQLETYQTLETSPGLEDLWQLHWSYNGLLEHNVPSQFIANIEAPAQIAALLTNPSGRGAAPAGAPGQPSVFPNGPQGNAAHSPAHWIKVSAQSDGTFTVTNSRNGFSKTYRGRS